MRPLNRFDQNDYGYTLAHTDDTTHNRYTNTKSCNEYYNRTYDKSIY